MILIIWWRVTWWLVWRAWRMDGSDVVSFRLVFWALVCAVERRKEKDRIRRQAEGPYYVTTESMWTLNYPIEEDEEEEKDGQTLGIRIVLKRISCSHDPFWLFSTHFTHQLLFMMHPHDFQQLMDPWQDREGSEKNLADANPVIIIVFL